VARVESGYVLKERHVAFLATFHANLSIASSFLRRAIPTMGSTVSLMTTAAWQVVLSMFAATRGSCNGHESENRQSGTLTARSQRSKSFR
jgi:hypothetical protein